MRQDESRLLAGLRVIYFGMGGAFSRLPLEALLRAGADLRALVEPADEAELCGEPLALLDMSLWTKRGAARRALPMAGGGTGRSLREIAAGARAPIYQVARLDDPATLDILAALQPDALCVACFTKRLPPTLLALPRLGALNAHPSLLPENRGPDPLFWTFQTGASETGVTLHLMDATLDTGPILAQRREPVIAGEGEAALETRLARQAGGLFIESLSGLRAGALIPTPQDQSRASYHPWPQASDYAVTANWDVRRAWVFARGVFGRLPSLTLTARDGARFQMIEPRGYTLGATLESAWRLDGEWLELALADGVLTCRAAPLG